MAEVRFYLFTGGRVQEAHLSVHRRLDTVLAAWEDFIAAAPDGCALIHVGTSAPLEHRVSSVLSEHPGHLLVSEPARWSMGLGHTDSVDHVATLLDDVLPPLPIRLALTGWGYSMDDPSSSIPEGISPPSEDSVADEIAYRERIGRIDIDDPHAVLAIAPRWLSMVPIAEVDLTVRCRNVLVTVANVQTVGDIRGVPPESMLKWRNFGKTSLRDLARALRQAIDSPLLAGHYSGRAVESQSQPLAPMEDQSPEVSAGEMEPMERMAVRILESYGGRPFYIVSAHLGRTGQVSTLQVLGEILGLSRERVRQIMVKAIRTLRQAGLGKVAARRIEVLLENRTRPLFVDMIGAEDPWFETEGASSEYIARLVHELCSPQYKCLRVDGRWVLSGLRVEWDGLLGRALTIAEEAAESRTTERSDIERDMLTVALAAGAPELGTALLDAVRPALRFASVGDGGKEVLVSVGSASRTIHAVTAHVLESSSGPIHFNEAAAEVSRILGEPAAPTTVQRYLSEIGLCLAQGTYGLARHIPLDEIERKRLTDVAVDVVLEGNSERQWHVKELIETISDRLDGVPECVDVYVLNALLFDVPDLRSLGRMVWIAASESGDVERIDIRGACVALLRRAGRPMTADELRREITQARGVNSGILLFPDATITRVGQSLWGLVDRDIPLSEREREEVCDAVLRRLNAQGYGMHVSEVIGALHESGLTYLGLTGGMVIGLALINPSLNVAQGELIHPAAWDTPRRLSLREAVLAAAARARTPATSEEIRLAAEHLAMRPLTSSIIAGLIRQAGLEYDPVTRSWERVLATSA